MAQTVGERLRQAREALGWTQSELAKRCGVDRTYIANIETGRSTRPEHMAEIARVLKVSPGWLAYGADWLDDLTPEELQAAKDLHDLPEAIKASMIELIRAASSKAESKS